MREFLNKVFDYMEKQGFKIKHTYSTLVFNGLYFSFSESKRPSIFYTKVFPPGNGMFAPEINAILLQEKEFSKDLVKYVVVEEAVHAWQFDYKGLTKKVQDKFLGNVRSQYHQKFKGNFKGLPIVKRIYIRELDKYLEYLHDEHPVVKALAVKFYQDIEGTTKGAEEALYIDELKDLLKLSVSELASKIML